MSITGESSGDDEGGVLERRDTAGLDEPTLALDFLAISVNCGMRAVASGNSKTMASRSGGGLGAADAVEGWWRGTIQTQLEWRRTQQI